MKPTDMTESLGDKVESAINWTLKSKIHNVDRSDSATLGSFNNYYDIRRRLCPYAYTEITGYGVELLLDLYKRTNRPEYLDNALTAGNWIMGMQYDGRVEKAQGAFLQSYHLLERKKNLQVFPFDTAICVGALSDLYGVSHNNAYLKSAERGVLWLVQKTQNEDGHFQPFYEIGQGDLEANTHLGRDAISASSDLRNTWYCLDGSHHGKIVIGLLKYHSKCRQSWLLEAISSLSQWLLKQQDPRGYFRVAPGSKAFFSHTHCYAIEGLLYAYSYLKNKRLLDAATLAADWLINVQRSDGSIPSWRNTHYILDYVDVSAVAQAIRLWSVLYSEKQTPKYYNALKKALEYLIKMQNLENGPTTFGGFYQAEFDLKLTKHKLKRLYSWTTMFAIHAMVLADEVPLRKIQGSELW